MIATVLNDHVECRSLNATETVKRAFLYRINPLLPSPVLLGCVFTARRGLRRFAPLFRGVTLQRRDEYYIPLKKS